MKNPIHSHHTLAGIVSAVVLSVPGWAMAQPGAMPAAHSTAVTRASTDKMQAGMEMRKSMDGMCGKTRAMTMSEDTDFDFATMMRMHHQGALDMAQAEIDKGKDPAMINIAKKIVLAQKKEIIEFDKWLEKHKK